MTFVSIFEKKFNYLKQIIGWLCLEPFFFFKNTCVGAGCTIFFMKINLFWMKRNFCHAWNAMRLRKD